ncbi:SCP2 sterol-binding domain-containing protein [Thalassobius sp. S69A]|uniref:SCP2 sterol-binding domain-containing protein n=1 Tax=unclassified Thalassovita TaxID=2619711 RepID=UPI000C11A092|nr:sterol carrier protein [Paracoccaceae bacterium]MBT26534.1 sterol carrier protein [Paracoccaceae bacterium]
MTLSDIAEMIRSSVAASNFTDSLKFDCGDQGVLVIADRAVSLEDRDTDVTLKMSAENVEKLIKGKLNPMTAVMMGKIKLAGNPAVAMKLKELL